MRKKMIPAILALALLAGCGTPAAPSASSSGDASLPPAGELEHYLDRTVVVEEIEIENEAVALSSSPAAIDIKLLPEASGKATKSGKNAVIDYSNTGDGYVMVQYTTASDKRLKVQVAGPNTTYTYDLPAQSWETFPLSDGNGNYKVTALQNTEGKKYAVLASASFSVTLKDEFAPYLRPNQYVDYSDAANTVAKAAELTSGVTDPLQKVEKIYDFVVKTLTYDKDKAATVQSGYLPVLDTVLSAKKGICFDYASLMAGMLRAEGVPCKLVVGYAGKAYHAWISVWTESTGWVDGIIYFDGSAWQRMDPTFASSSNASEEIMKYIGDGSNYTVKYLY
ncbi:transglutaminase-like domain-containing protein [Oscillospiraceae bacterium 50-16]|nr:transglutaminase domain-containing protein [Lawsonibacter sp.]